MPKQLTQIIKNIVGRIVFGIRLHRLLAKDKAIVVAFHTIGDNGMNNSIQVSPAQFQKYCSFFDRYFDVVSLTELLNDIRAGRDVSGKLVITFDDGYRDNYTFAAPELERMGLPATFFVTTDFIGSTTVPWWDEEANVKSEWMTWDEVIDLDRRGFDIGAHTKSHANLRLSSEDIAMSEISGSKQILENKLGHTAAHFAYPYGRETDINERSLSLIREAGFSGCVSCFGGAASLRSDPMNLPRVPINDWYGSPFHFGLDVTRSLRTPAGEYGGDEVARKK